MMKKINRLYIFVPLYRGHIILDGNETLEDPEYRKHECTILRCCCICCALLRWVHSPQCSCYLDLKGTLGMDFAMQKRWRNCTCFSNTIFKQHLIIPTHAIRTLDIQSIQGSNTQLTTQVLAKDCFCNQMSFTCILPNFLFIVHNMWKKRFWIYKQGTHLFVHHPI